MDGAKTIGVRMRVILVAVVVTATGESVIMKLVCVFGADEGQSSWLSSRGRAAAGERVVWHAWGVRR